jgi:hypothetical protein
VALTLSPDAPPAPRRAELEALLDDLAELIAVGGWERVARPPVQPGERSFPDPWQPTPAGVDLLVQRLRWHAGVDVAITVDDRREQAGPRPRRAVTEAEIVAAGDDAATLALYAIGDDDVVGTLAHEVGLAWVLAGRRRTSAPFREGAATEPTDEDRARGSLAAVYLGLGVIATAAAYQQFTGGTYQVHLGFAPIEYDVIQAGHLPLAAMAFLLAVQAEVRGERAVAGLKGPADDEVRAWRRALLGQGPALRERLGIPAPMTWPALDRPLPPAPEAALPEARVPRRAEGKRVFRVRGRRSGLGFLAGSVGGAVVTVALGAAGAEAAALLAGGMATGAAVGRRIRVARCSECIERVAIAAAECPRCGGDFVGDIDHRDERLAAEEATEER